MTRFLRGMIRAVAESFELPEPILELGSLQVEGGSDSVNLRHLFPGKTYTGVDFRAGPGVDCVANVEQLPQESKSVGTVLTASTFEHVKRFWVAFDEVHRVLRPDGVLVCALPFYFQVHAYPSDYWRFTPEGLDLMLEPYRARLLGWQGASRRMNTVWCVAFGERCRLPSSAEIERYRQLMHVYAHEPLGWRRHLLYRAGRLLCGSRPFAPHLDRNKWTMDLRGFEPAAAESLPIRAVA
jgi:SAM-dependent methyltransferase